MFPSLKNPHVISANPINTEKTDFSVLFAKFPGNNQEHPASSDWLTSAALWASSEPSITAVSRKRYVGTPVTVSRNRAALDAIDTYCDYIFMIDNDMEPDCEPDGKNFLDVAWEFMLSRRHREKIAMQNRTVDDPENFDYWWTNFAPCIIGAPYCGPSPVQNVYVMEFKERKGSGHPDVYPRLTQFGRHQASTRSGIERVAALPTGLILIDTRMFLYLPTPWFEYEYTNSYHGQVATTEDVFFGRNATYMGMSSYAAWDCWAAHHKLEQVRKPRPITIDEISEQISTAIRDNLNSRNKLHFVSRDATDASEVAPRQNLCIKNN